MKNVAQNTWKCALEDFAALAWSIPVYDLCRAFGISDRGLAKRLDKHGLPAANQGHWAKLRAGQPVRYPYLDELSRSRQIELLVPDAFDFAKLSESAEFQRVRQRMRDAGKPIRRDTFYEIVWRVPKQELCLLLALNSEELTALQQRYEVPAPSTADWRSVRGRNPPTRILLPLDEDNPVVLRVTMDFDIDDLLARAAKWGNGTAVYPFVEGLSREVELAVTNWLVDHAGPSPANRDALVEGIRLHHLTAAGLSDVDAFLKTMPTYRDLVRCVATLGPYATPVGRPIADALASFALHRASATVDAAVTAHSELDAHNAVAAPVPVKVPAAPFEVDPVPPSLSDFPVVTKPPTASPARSDDAPALPPRSRRPKFSEPDHGIWRVDAVASVRRPTGSDADRWAIQQVDNEILAALAALRGETIELPAAPRSDDAPAASSIRTGEFTQVAPAPLEEVNVKDTDPERVSAPTLAEDLRVIAALAAPISPAPTRTALLIEWMEAQPDAGWQQQRDFAIVLIMTDCNLSIAQVVSMQTAGLDMMTGRARYLARLGAERIAQLSDRCLSALREYRRMAPNSTSEALFLGSRTAAYNDQAFRRNLADYASAAGLGRFQLKELSRG